MKQIEIRNGEVCVVDDSDFENLIRFSWHLCPTRYKGRIWKYAGTTSYASGKRTTMMMHRLILNVPRGSFVDHINGDGLDNRRSNIRICSHKQNMMNRKKPSSNTSGFKGVTKENKKWLAQIWEDKKLHRIGLFETPEEAAIAYDSAATKRFGVFANLNFPIRVG